jgi:hypothetical protein
LDRRGIVAARPVISYKGADEFSQGAEGDWLMAEENGMDYAEHERTYALFVAMFKWGTIAVAILLVLMAIFLV